jgi:membrane-bound lytic murein transglycosylase D
MPQTARAYGMTVSEHYDQRMGVWRSTEAAAEHLEDLYTRFQSWELALAAYNLGYQGLERRVAEHGTDNFWELAALGALPRETRLYVPKVLATAVLLNNLKFFGFGAVERLEPIDAVALDVPPAVPLATLARAAGTSVRVLRDLNPELRGKTTPDHGSEITVRIPSRGLARAKVMLPKLLGPDHDIRVAVSEDFDWGRDDLGSDGQSRLERTNASLSLAPNPPAEEVSKGDPSPLLPTPGSLTSTKPRAKVDAVRSSLPVDVMGNTPVLEGSTLTGSELLYRVRRGDTLAKIAWNFGYRYPDLARQNNLRDPSYVQSGQMLTIESPKRISSRLRGGLYYRVKDGDTLESLRERLKVEPLAQNAHPDALKVGELLRVQPLIESEGG